MDKKLFLDTEVKDSCRVVVVLTVIVFLFSVFGYRENEDYH